MDESVDLPNDNVLQIRDDYFKALAIEHNLTIEEIQKIHEATIAKLTKTETKGAMFMNLAFPAAIKNYKEKRD